MMRTLAALVTLLALAAHAAAVSPADVKKQGVAKVVITSSSPPHGFLDAKTNSLKGIMFEIAQAIAADWGVKAEFTEVPFGSLIPTLTSRRADLMSAPLFITPQRAEVVDFSDPVYGWGEGLVVALPPHRSRARRIDLQIGLITTYVPMSYGVLLGAYSGYIGGRFDTLVMRILDVAMVDPPSIAYQIVTHGIPGITRVENYTPVNAWRIGLAVNKGDKELLDAINDSLRKLKQSGQLKKILDGWGVGHLIAS